MQFFTSNEEISQESLATIFITCEPVKNLILFSFLKIKKYNTNNYFLVKIWIGCGN